MQVALKIFTIFYTKAKLRFANKREHDKKAALYIKRNKKYRLKLALKNKTFDVAGSILRARD